MFLNVELDRAIGAKQKCPNLIHEGLHPNSKKRGLIN